jgi:hypothetical protein
MPRQAGDHEYHRAKVAGEGGGHPQPVGGGVARSDQGDAGRAQQIVAPEDAQHRRRVGQGAQGGGIIGVGQGDQATAEAGDGLQFAFGDAAPGDRDGLSRAAAAGEVGQGVEGGGGGAEAREQAAEGHGTDVLGAIEAEPVPPFLIRKTSVFHAIPAFS